MLRGRADFGRHAYEQVMVVDRAVHVSNTDLYNCRLSSSSIHNVVCR